MKRGVKKRNFLENMIILTIYFIIFSGLILAIGELSGNVFEKPTILNIIMYIFSILLALVFLILFISGWEDLFESNGHP